MNEEIIAIKNDLYQDLKTKCLFNKIPFPSKDVELEEKVNNTIIRNKDYLNEEVIKLTKKNLYFEWRKDQKSFQHLHKGFHIALKFAIEKSIPRSLEQIHEENPELNIQYLELLDKTNKQHFRVYKEFMIFQKGTAEYMHNYARYIPEEDYLFRSNSALQKSKSLKIDPIERWNYITASLWEYIKTNNIDTTKSKYEHLKQYPIGKKRVKPTNPFDSIDKSTEK